MFARSWSLLRQNWSIVVPGFVVAFVFGGVLPYLIVRFFSTGQAGVWVPFLLLDVVVGQIIAIGFVTGMAAAAWQRGRATFSDGSAAFRHHGGRILPTLLALLCSFGAAVLLVPFTFAIPLIVLILVCQYTMAAAVVGEHGGFGALVESYWITLERLGFTAKVIGMQLLISACASIAGAAFAQAPLLRSFVSQGLSQIGTAYLTLVVVGAYLTARPVGEAAFEAFE